MQIDRLVSLVIAISWIVAYFVVEPPTRDSGADVLALPGIALVLLALIWFGDELGEFTGLTPRGHYISKTSPGWMVKLLGWIFMVTLIGIWINHVIK